VLGVSILPLISRAVLWLSGVTVLGLHGGVIPETRRAH